MTIKYYGKKSAENLRVTSQILPNKKIDRIIEACFGSGSFTRHVSCEKEDIQRVQMVITERKYTSAISEDKQDGIVKKKKCKVEVVYINYQDIVGSWENFEYFDYDDVLNGNVRISIKGELVNG